MDGEQHFRMNMPHAIRRGDDDLHRVAFRILRTAKTAIEAQRGETFVIHVLDTGDGNRMRLGVRLDQVILTDNATTPLCTVTWHVGWTLSPPQARPWIAVVGKPSVAHATFLARVIAHDDGADK